MLGSGGWDVQWRAAVPARNGGFARVYSRWHLRSPAAISRYDRPTQLFFDQAQAVAALPPGDPHRAVQPSVPRQPMSPGSVASCDSTDSGIQRGLREPEVALRRGKGAEDRVTVLPDTVRQPLAAHLEEVKALHEADLAEGAGRMALPGALARKFPPASRGGVRGGAAESLAPERDAAGHDGGGTPSGGGEAGPAAIRCGIRSRRICSRRGTTSVPSRGAAGPSGRQHDDDLYPCAHPGRDGGAEPRGFSAWWRSGREGPSWTSASRLISLPGLPRAGAGGRVCGRCRG
jgi:hypothetical protein